MAAIASTPVNLTPAVMENLTISNKLDKQPEIKEIALDSDSESVHEQTVVYEGISRIGIVHDHVEVRSSLHKESVHLRQDLQLHLRSVMRTGDEMLVKIRSVIEELDTAVHARHLAEGELRDVESKRDVIKKQLEISTKECSVLRIRLLEMSKARDRAEIDLESARGLLLEKTEECNELKRESARLHIQIADLSKKLLIFTSRLTEAESKIRFYISEIEKLKKEVESYKLKIVEVEKLNITLAKEVKELTFENKDLKIRVEKLKVDLIGLKTRLTTITAELHAAKIEVEKFKVERDEAVISLEIAIKDRDRAIVIAEEAVIAKEDAISSRDQAIYQESITNGKWVRDSALLEDAQRSLTSIRKRVLVVTKERDDAVEKSHSFEHLRDEALESFREADKARHHLIHQLQKANDAKKLAHMEVEIAKEEVREVQRSFEIVIKEKEQVEIVLSQTEREKNNAIAAQLKMQEEYIEADRQRDEAIKKYEDMEDLYQEADKALALAVGKLEASQTAEKAASFQVEQLTAKLEKAQKAETSLRSEKTHLNEKLKSAQTVAEQSKSELDVQIKKYTKDTVKLQKDLSTVQANEQVLIKSNQQLLADKAGLNKTLAETKKTSETEKAGLSKELTETKKALESEQAGFNKQLAEAKKAFEAEKATLAKQLEDAKKSLDSPIPENHGIVIRHIFFGSVRITSPAVYQKVLDSYAHHDGCSFTVNSKFVEGADPDHQSTLVHPRYLAVYYAVRQNGKLVDQLPIWYKEGSKDNKFHPH